MSRSRTCAISTSVVSRSVGRTCFGGDRPLTCPAKDELQGRTAPLQCLVGFQRESGPCARHVFENGLHSGVRSPLRQLLTLSGSDSAFE